MAPQSPIGHPCGFCGQPAWFEEVSTEESSGTQPKAYSRIPGETEAISAVLYRCSGCEKCSIFYFVLPDDYRQQLISLRAGTGED